MNISALVPFTPEKIDACRRALKIIVAPLSAVVPVATIVDELNAQMHLTPAEARIMYLDYERYFGQAVDIPSCLAFGRIVGAIMTINGHSSYSQSVG
jgi:hypothetical protein